MKKLLQFIFSKVFLINLLIAGIIFAGLFFGISQYLKSVTQHGETITVPDFRGFQMEELDNFIADKQLNYTIMDSVYDLNESRGIVLDQTPPPDAHVKEGRKIYLTVNAKLPPKVAVPRLKDLSQRQAVAIIESYGLKVGKFIYKPAQCSNCVLGIEQNGEEVKAGQLLIKGTEINLILGEGESKTLVPLPYLGRLTYDEAEDYLKEKALNVIGNFDENCETETDSANARVYKQFPAYEEEAMINQGKEVFIYLTCDTAKLPHITLDTLRN